MIITRSLDPKKSNVHFIFRDDGREIAFAMINNKPMTMYGDKLTDLEKEHIKKEL